VTLFFFANYGQISPKVKFEKAAFTPRKVDGSIWLRMSGREEIKRKIAAAVGSAQVIHHLFSYEIEITSPTKARSIWSMEDWFLRSDREEAVADADSGIEAFRTMHGYGHYHGRYEKVDGIWFIADLEQTRVKLDFT
jgi:SnoaL-like domain